MTKHPSIHKPRDFHAGHECAVENGFKPWWLILTLTVITLTGAHLFVSKTYLFKETHTVGKYVEIECKSPPETNKKKSTLNKTSRIRLQKCTWLSSPWPVYITGTGAIYHLYSSIVGAVYHAMLCVPVIKNPNRCEAFLLICSPGWVTENGT